MKKNIITFFIIFLLFFGFSLNVNAAQKIGVCTYNVNPIDDVKAFQLQVTLYNDGTTTKTAKLGSTPISEEQIKDAGTLDEENLIFFQMNNIFEPNGLYYQEYKKAKNCPSMQFIYRKSFGLYEFHVGNTMDTGVDKSQTVTPNIEEFNSDSGEVIEDTFEGCTYTSTVRVNAYGYISVHFFYRGDKKYFELLAPSLSGSAEIDRVISAGGMDFQVNQDDVDKFMSNPCKDIKLYVRAIANNENNIMFQTTEPSPYEKGPNAMDQGVVSDYDKESSHVDLSGLNGTIGCEGIFGKIDANGDFEKESFGWILQTILNYIKIIGPILVILFSMMEFIKAIATSDEDAMKKAQSRLVIRLIAVVTLFLLPFLVGEVLKLINGISNPTCGFK